MMNYIPAVAPPSCRNKGIICKNYFTSKKCPQINCPYAHIQDGEELPVPDTICLFYQQNKCLRESCKFFHGSKQDFAKIKATGSPTYRPQDFVPVEAPPTESPQSVMIPLITPRPLNLPQLPPQQQQMMIVPQQPQQFYPQMLQPPMQQPFFMPPPQQQQPFYQMQGQPHPMPQGSVAPQLFMSNGQIYQIQPVSYVIPAPPQNQESIVWI